MRDFARHKTKWIIYKTFGSSRRVVSVFYDNVLLNEGINNIWSVLVGAGTVFSSPYIGVGDGATAEVATQTGLVGSNVAYAAMDSGYPTYGSNQKIIFQSSFEDGIAEFNWREFTVGSANSNSGINLNRALSDQGLKIPGSIWTVRVEITLV